MSGDKVYYVVYTGAGVVTLVGAGKFMAGTGAFLAEPFAREAAARGDFVVEGLNEPAAPKPNGTIPAPPAAAPTPAPGAVAPAAVAPAPAPGALAPTPASGAVAPTPRAAASTPTPPATATPAPAPAAAPPLATTVVPWRSERTHCDTRLASWGHAGAAVLILPPFGGTAEDIDREKLVLAMRPLLDAGKLKVWSCDDVAGRAIVASEGDPGHRMWLMNQFQEYIVNEVVPAIRSDGVSGDIIVAGAGIGALHAAALVCRHPEIFSRALCASGTYRVERLLETTDATDDLRAASPLHIAAALGDGETLARLRTRFVLLACGEGEGEDIGESWDLARALGDKGVPNRVEPLGRERGRDWDTWRQVFPKVLGDWLA
jgi:esterase/lipase superfamily enzyme